MKILFFALWAIALALGIVGLGERLVWGHKLVNYGSYVPWGLWVAAYIYFIGFSAGAFILSSLVYLFGVKQLEKTGKLALFTALIALFMAMISILLDLGHMGRAWRLILTPNFTSMMSWMVWLYTAYFLLLLTEIYFVLRPEIVQLSRQPTVEPLRHIYRCLTAGYKDLSEKAITRDRKIVKILATIGVPLAIAYYGGVGALFAVVGAKPYWHSSMIPILFLTGALASGGALLTALVAFFWKRDEEQKEIVKFLGKIVLGLLCFDLILKWSQISIPLWADVEYHTASLKLVLFGPYWYVFWIFHLFLGSLIPIYLLWRKAENVAAVGTACSLIALTFLSVRLNIVIPGQVVPELKGLESAYIEPHLTFQYFPTFHEWRVVLFVVSLGVILFYIGWRILPIGRKAEALQ